MSVTPKYSHALDINTLSDQYLFYSEIMAEIIVWQRLTKKVGESVIDSMLEKMDIQERMTYPEYVNEFSDREKKEIMFMQWQPKEFIENIIYVTKLFSQ